MSIKLIILDRDGVINYDSLEYIKSPAEWIAIPRSLEAIARLTRAGYTISVATNQSGIAHGLYPEETLKKIHEKMLLEVSLADGEIDSIFYCPHAPSDKCSCRKPKAGLFEKIAQHYQMDLRDVPAAGDKLSDMQAAHAVGCKLYLVESDLYPQATDLPVQRCKDLAEAVNYILDKP